jgi:hypothetical protein
MPGFGPAAEILFFREKDPKPFPPRSATFNRADASPRRADQLAGLRQGPQIFLSVSPVGRPAGGGQVEPLHLFRWPLSPVPYIGSKDGCRIGNVGHDVGNDAQCNGSVSGLRGSRLGEILRVPQDDPVARGVLVPGSDPSLGIRMTIWEIPANNCRIAGEERWMADDGLRYVIIRKSPLTPLLSKWGNA